MPTPSSDTDPPRRPATRGPQGANHVHPAAAHLPRPPQNRGPTGRRPRADRAHRDRTCASNPDADRPRHNHADHGQHRTATRAGRRPHRPNAAPRRLLPRPGHPRSHLFPECVSCDRHRRPSGLLPRPSHAQAPAPSHRTAPRRTTSGRSFSRSHHSVRPGGSREGPQTRAPPPTPSLDTETPEA